MQAHEKLIKARAGLVLDQPFFGALALRLTLVADPSCKTAKTNGLSIKYNPTFVDGLSLSETKGVLAHEVMHVAAAHHARRQDRDPKKWNMAGDYAINDILLSCGFVLPQRALTGYGTDQSAEAIYSRLPDQPKDPNGTGEDSDPGGCGEVCDAPGDDGKPASQQDLAQAEAEARVAVSQAAQAAKAMGALPAALARLVEEILDPILPWREVLRRFVDESSRDDYTWTRPSRRYAAQGLYLPSLYSEQLRPLAVALDTSGSISQAELDQFGAEITAILQDTQTSATVIYCDTEVNGTEEFDKDSDVKLSAHGGGGTDFRPPFAEVDKQGLQPSCLIYLTDGECSRFPEAPEYPVLWAIIGRRGFYPPFGEVMQVK